MAQGMVQAAFPQQMVGHTFQQPQPLQLLLQQITQQQQQQQQQPVQVNQNAMLCNYQQQPPLSSQSMNILLAQRQQKIQRDHASLLQQLAQKPQQLQFQQRATPASAPMHAGPIYHNYQQLQAPMFVSMGLSMQMPVTYIQNAPTTTYMPPFVTIPAAPVVRDPLTSIVANNNDNSTTTPSSSSFSSSPSSSKRKAIETDTEPKKKIKRDDCGRFSPKPNKAPRKVSAKRHSVKPLNQNPQSKYRCVRWYKRTSRWVVQVRINGARKHVGYFDHEEEAAAAYRDAMAKWKNDSENTQCV